MNRTLSIPAGFPDGIELEDRTFENWSQMLRLTDVRTAKPTTDEQALAIVRWAAAVGWRVRPVGAMHSWVPIMSEHADGVIAIDQSAMSGLVDFQADPVPMATFRCGTTLADALRILEGVDNGGRSEAPGWVWPDFPGIPDVTIGGMCAIGAHGAGIRLRDDQEDLYGTVSNLILGFRAIVSEGNDYIIREFTRDDPDAGAFLVHLGNAYLLDVQMRVVPNCTLSRRVQYPDWTEVFAAPSDALPPMSLQSLVEEHGRVQQLWFPFTHTPIVQHFTEDSSIEGVRVSAPLTVRLSPTLPPAFTAAFGGTLGHLPWLTPLVERATLREMRHLSPPDHVWHGTAGNTLLYVQHDTLRVISLAYAILVQRGEVQAAIHALGHKFDGMLHEYAHAGLEPINSCLELRVTDVDRTASLGLPGAVPATLSPVRPLPDADVDRAIWFDLVTVPGTPHCLEFYMEFEAWLWQRFAVPGTLRAEWSKAWAVGPDGPWTNRDLIDRILRSYDANGTLATARQVRDVWRRFDIRGVYGSALTEGIFNGDDVSATSIP